MGTVSGPWHLSCAEPCPVKPVLEGSGLHAGYVDRSSMHGGGRDHNRELAKQGPIGVRALEVRAGMDELDGAVVQVFDRPYGGRKADRKAVDVFRPPFVQIGPDREQQLLVEQACFDARVPVIYSEMRHGAILSPSASQGCRTAPTRVP